MKGKKETERRLAEIERQLDRVYTALVVRDPGTPLSADAYEGLRKQVVASAQARTTHVAQLAEFDVALQRGASADDLRQLSSQWLQQAGVVRVEDADVPEAFEATVAPGTETVVEIPAYRDTATNRIVRQGRLCEVHPETSATSQPESAARGAVPAETPEAATE